jgi:hypothetical protein
MWLVIIITLDGFLHGNIWSKGFGRKWGQSWVYGCGIYYYLCNQCTSPLMLWVRIRLDEVYLIQHYVIKFVSDLRQVSDFLWVLRFFNQNRMLNENLLVEWESWFVCQYINWNLTFKVQMYLICFQIYMIVCIYTSFMFFLLDLSCLYPPPLSRGDKNIYY